MLMSNGQLAPIGLADATPTATNALYYPRTGLALTQAFSSYAAIYRSQVWVATLVDKLAYATARLPLNILATDTNAPKALGHEPYARLLAAPNSLHDPFFLWLWTASTFEIYGEALWVKVRPGVGEPPAQVWPVHPSNVFTRRDRDTGELFYVYHLGSATQPIAEWPARDVVHFKNYNPDDQVRGLSRLEPLRPTLVNEDASRRAQGSFWTNGARPSVILSHPQVLKDAPRKRIEESWNAMHAGVDRWGKAAILEEGMTATVIQLSPEEMQYIESRKLNREEACARYDVPPPVVHILDRATFSNITEQMRSMYRDTMAPRLGLYESVLETQLRSDFDPRGRMKASFQMEEVLRGSPEQRAAANQQMVLSAQKTPNEARSDWDLPPLPGGDDLYINAATVPLEQISDDTNPQRLGSSQQPDQQNVIESHAVCGACHGDGPFSARGLCRSCEGKSARALAKSAPNPEVTADA